MSQESPRIRARFYGGDLAAAFRDPGKIPGTVGSLKTVTEIAGDPISMNEWIHDG